MRAAGGAPSTWSSKLERALGGRVTHPVRPGAEGLSPASRAGEVVHAHLLEQVDAMINRDWQARHDLPDGVHKMRVATRRLRSALATFRPLFDRQVTDPIRDELKWIAAELGGARDAEVLRTRLLTELAAEADDLVLGPISARIEVELLADHRKAHDALVVSLRSERYFRLLDRLDALIAEPPFTPLADGKAGKVLTKRVRKSYARVETLVSAGAPEDDAHRDEWYHEIRKASKRLRYAAESVAPAFGKPATDLAESAELLQEVLGEHQDSVVARAALRELGVRIYLDGENAFTIGRLHALEQTRGDEAIAEFESAWSALSDKQMLQWLRT
jgi:CHAD domain-containing protein